MKLWSGLSSSPIVSICKHFIISLSASINLLFDKYKFATITFEHDFYRGDFYDTRYISRQILHKRGYVLLFPDVGIGIDTNFSSFEDWWVHPDLVNSEFIKKHYNNTNSITCHQIIKKMF